MGTRGNYFKLYKNSFRLDVRKYFFTCRGIDVWNSLDNVIVCFKLFKDFNDKLKNSKYLECFLKRRYSFDIALLVCSCMLVLLTCITCIANKLN